MTQENLALEEAIMTAFSAEGQFKEANRAYLEFIKANFTIPIEKGSEEEPRVLYAQEGELVFLPVFTNEADLKQWAAPIEKEIALLRLSGVDLLKGVGDSVYVALNLGGKSYKEFNPQEIARMRSIVLKFFNRP